MNNRWMMSAALASLMLVPLSASAQQVLTTTPPPAPIVENQPPSPGANYTWVGGYWSWNGTQYGWTAGHWEQTPAVAQSWEAPAWERQGQGYRFRPGHWRGRNGAAVQTTPTTAVGVPVGMAPSAVAQQAPTTVYVNTPPPQPIAEAQPPSPGPNFVWISGFWSWNGTQHVWTAGRWEQPPAATQAWQPPAWEREAQGYRFRPGRWGARTGMQPATPPPVVVVQPTAPPPVVVAQPVAPPPVVIAQPVAPPVVAQPTTVVVTRPPPPMRAERRPPRTLPGQVWVPGFWSWNGAQHVWTAGHWEAPPRPTQRWSAPRWTRQGRNWTWQPGTWR